jgi:hypothetical protein
MQIDALKGGWLRADLRETASGAKQDHPAPAEAVNLTTA